MFFFVGQGSVLWARLHTSERRNFSGSRSRELKQFRTDGRGVDSLPRK